MARHTIIGSSRLKKYISDFFYELHNKGIDVDIEPCYLCDGPNIDKIVVESKEEIVNKQKELVKYALTIHVIHDGKIGETTQSLIDYAKANNILKGILKVEYRHIDTFNKSNNN